MKFWSNLSVILLKLSVPNILDGLNRAKYVWKSSFYSEVAWCRQLTLLKWTFSHAFCKNFTKLGSYPFYDLEIWERLFSRNTSEGLLLEILPWLWISKSQVDTKPWIIKNTPLFWCKMQHLIIHYQSIYREGVLQKNCSANNWTVSLYLW